MLRTFLITLIVSVGLSACAPLAAIAPVTVQRLSQIAELGEQLVREDIDAARDHRELRAESIERAFVVCISSASQASSGGLPWKIVKDAIETCVALLDDNEPKLLIERLFELKVRLRELKEGAD